MLLLSILTIYVPVNNEFKIIIQKTITHSNIFCLHFFPKLRKIENKVNLNSCMSQWKYILISMSEKRQGWKRKIEKRSRRGKIQKLINLHFKKLLFFPLLSLRVVWSKLYPGNIKARERYSRWKLTNSS